MKIDYTAEQKEYAEQMKDVEQGVIVYLHPGAVTGDAWNPTVGASTSHTLSGYSKGVSQKYIDGTFIVSTDIEITTAAFAVSPVSSGTLTVDGSSLQIIKIIQIPAAGTAVAWKFIVRV